MSTREYVYSLIDRLSEEQLKGLILLLQGGAFPVIPEVEPDEIDMEMIRRAEAENDGETITIEELAKELGIDHDSL